MAASDDCVSAFFRPFTPDRAWFTDTGSDLVGDHVNPRNIKLYMLRSADVSNEAGSKIARLTMIKARL